MIPVGSMLNQWLAKYESTSLSRWVENPSFVCSDHVRLFALTVFSRHLVFVRNKETKEHYQLAGPDVSEDCLVSACGDWLTFDIIEVEMETPEQDAIEEIAHRVWSDVYTPLSMFGCVGEGIDHGNINQNDTTTLNAIESLSELEECDPRLMVVVAAARIDKALMEMLELYGRDLKRMPGMFMSRIKAAHREALIDERLRSFATKLRLLRNQIVHCDTRQDCMVSGRLARQTEQLCQLSAAVPVWGPCEPMEPQRRFSRRIYAAMLSGVLAFELTFFDDAENVRVKSFESVRDYVFDCPEIARVAE